MPYLLNLIAILVLFNSCKKDKGDVTQPNITIVSPTASTLIESGNILPLEIVVSDNMALASLNVKVYPEFQGSTMDPYNTTYTDILSGTSANSKKSLSIPVNTAAGTYTVELLAKDASGNTKGPLKQTIKILNKNDKTHEYVKNVTDTKHYIILNRL